jgi:hypothetical protein
MLRVYKSIFPLSMLHEWLLLSFNQKPKKVEVSTDRFLLFFNPFKFQDIFIRTI